MSGGPKTSTDDELLAQVKGAMTAGATGLAVGRNVWQRSDPFVIAEALKDVVFRTKVPADAPRSPPEARRSP